MAQLSPDKDSVAMTSATIDTPGAGFDRWWLLVVAVIATLAILVFSTPDPYGRAFRFVWDGVYLTIGITVVSFLIIVFVGLLGGLGRLSKNRLVQGVATLYVEMVRGIPLMVQLLFWYFAFPQVVQKVGVALNFEPLKRYFADPVMMAILGLTVCYGAYMSEIYRAGIQSIGKGQMEAARSLGMSQVQAMRYVVLPQALRVVLPPMGNEFISLLKDSSLVSVVAVADLTRRGREFMSQTATPIETWTVVALMYLVMTILSARVVNWVEKKTKTV